jgi:SWIM zinc finger
MEIFRVKMPILFDTKSSTAQTIYYPTRFVIFIRGSSSICSCLFGRYQGIPCRHIFAVLNDFPHLTFNISDVHQHWQYPDKRVVTKNRTSISLLREYTFSNAHDNTPPRPAVIAAQADAKGSPGRKSNLEQHTTSQSKSPFIVPEQEAYMATPRSRYSTRYNELNPLMNEFLKANHSKARHIEALKNLTVLLEEAKDENCAVTIETREGIQQTDIDGTPVPKTPTKFPKVGRKQSKRIKSSTEKSPRKKHLIPKGSQAKIRTL